MLLLFIFNESKKDILTNNQAQVLSFLDYKINVFIEDIEEVSEIIDTVEEKELNYILNNIVKFKREVKSIIVLNTNGIVDLTLSKNENNNLFSGFDYSNKEIYKRFKRENKSFFSDVYLSGVENILLVSYVFKSKNKIYILDINLEIISTYLNTINSNDEIFKVIDKNGLFIVNTNDKNDVLNRTSFYTTNEYKNGVLETKEYIATEIYSKKENKDFSIMYTKQKQTSWLIVAAGDFNNLNQFIISTIVWIILFVIIIIVISIISSIKISNTIIEPVEYIIDELNKFAISQKSHQVNIDLKDVKYPIFISLIETFNIMQNKIIKREEILQNFNMHLEEKINEKTIALENLNKDLEKRIDIAINENKSKEKILFEQNKMAAMGEMIGNIAHQWRQPLSVVSTIASTMHLQKENNMEINDEKFLKNMVKIIDTTQYLSHTVDDFRNFFKEDKIVSNFTVKSLVYNNMNLMELTLKDNNINVVIDLEDCEISGFYNELTQALINIMKNANDALCDNKNESKKLIVISSKLSEDFVNISIQDNAGGVPDKIISKIYEPYFTTKHQSFGTGIGLFMTREIIVNHMKGTLEVKNKSFKYEDIEYIGACFNIILPKKINE